MRRRHQLALFAALALNLAWGSELRAGVTYRHDAGKYPAQLRNEKWGVAVSGGSWQGRDDDGAFQVAAPDVKPMVVQAVQDLTGGADRVPLETRQELAKIAAKVFENAESTTKEGMLGDVEYRIGRYAFTSRPNFNSIKFDSSPPNRGVKTLWMPFVAVRLVDPAVTHYQRGVAEMKSGFWVLAQDEFEAAVRLDERFARAYVRRAQVYLHGEKYSDAWADFEKAVELEPRGVSCRLFYALALITAQERARADLTKAKAAAEKACELTGQRDPLCLQILAAVHARTGDFEKAAECQNRALALLYEAERGEIPGRRLDLYKKGLLNNLDFDEERIELCRPESPR